MPSLLDLYSRLGTDAVQGAKVAGNSLMDFYNKPVVDRASMLPIGQYADGSLTFAVPGMIKDTYDSILNSYGDVAAGRTPRTQDVLNVASAPMMGNFAAKAAGLMPEGALGVGASKPPTGGIRAYHGSPHDFDKFDALKIGTGEGAQAYGHGLYFAESEGVARSYRDDAMSESGGVTYKGNLADAQEAINRANQRPMLPGEDMATYLERRAKQIERVESATNIKTAVPDILRQLDPDKDVGATVGRMYEVNINAQPEQFIDWDKPLSQQSEAVRNALSRLSLTADKYGDVKASDALGAIGSETADKLKSYGIPGVRYFDQMSRDVGDGSRNYVVFPGNESLIDIQRKYANPAEGSLLSLAQQFLNQDEQANGPRR
jgi:hypothetical protein